MTGALYPILNDKEKADVRAALLAHIDKAWYFAKRTANYVGGHWGGVGTNALLGRLLRDLGAT